MVALSLFLLVGLLLGAVFLRAGLRGRVIGDHPHCRHCGFDLFGKPEGSDRCAECGADLSHPRAIRVGLRVRRRGMLVSGSTLVLLCVLVAALGGWVALSQVKLTAYLPTWWLARDARSVVPAVRDAAVGELIARLGSNQLSQAQIDSIADQMLALQADRSTKWYAGWGDFVERSRASGKLSDDRWKTYAGQAPNYFLKIRPKVRRGDPMVVWIATKDIRVGNNSPLQARHTALRYMVGGHDLSTGHMTSTMGLHPGGSGASGTHAPINEVIDKLKDGEQSVHATFEVAIGPAGMGEDQAIVTKRFELDGSFTLLPADEQTVTISRDPAHREGVQKALSVRYAQFDRQGYLNMNLNVDGIPVGIGFDVFARDDKGNEELVGSFACPAGTKAHSWGMGGSTKFANPPQMLDFVLRPTTQPAVASLDTTEIWDDGKEVVIANVAVRPPATRPGQ